DLSRQRVPRELRCRRQLQPQGDRSGFGSGEELSQEPALTATGLARDPQLRRAARRGHRVERREESGQLLVPAYEREVREGVGLRLRRRGDQSVGLAHGGEPVQLYLAGGLVEQAVARRLVCLGPYPDL